ncbi:hypothetical protein [Arthrobacter psychrochitiniphilus]|nr:hypothetical protein [Arthrobacter psychrochitiniphilus]NYG18077.1 hypothetical protein [Arthrobacter psychrochitiniphilus]
MSTLAGASLLLLGLSLAGCSTSTPGATTETSNSTSSTQGGAEAAVDVQTPASTAATPSATASEKAGAQGRTVTMHVEGAKSDALVKALVVTDDGKESGGEMTSQKLPFDQEVTLPAGAAFTKVLVLGKYASGATGEISCSISIDGVNVSSQSSTNHKPAECLFVEKNTK